MLSYITWSTKARWDSELIEWFDTHIKNLAPPVSLLPLQWCSLAFKWESSWAQDGCHSSRPLIQVKQQWRKKGTVFFCVSFRGVRNLFLEALSILVIFHFPRLHFMFISKPFIHMGNEITMITVSEGSANFFCRVSRFSKPYGLYCSCSMCSYITNTHMDNV